MEMLSTEQCRVIAQGFGQEEQFDRLIAARAALDFEQLDQILDELVPGHDGPQATFLPSFAMTSCVSIARDRPSWRRLRDRVFDNMEALKHRPDVPAWGIALVDAWRNEYADFAREADSDYLEQHEN